ncbi:MAG TPA: carbohydrate-binding family 9-like protein [Tepidisphaeraceae bacterium]|nr:carbohydrate-binding family 9-like protein [Tepidisphaeraceae bacterium]
MIDGVLEKPQWQHAARVDLQLYSGGRPTYGTIVRMLWSSRDLYVAFECQDPEPTASMDRRDEPLFQEGNVVELFVDPVGHGTTLFEFEVNPLGTVMDLFYDPLDMSWREAVKWNGQGVRAAARIIRDSSTDQPTGWTAELAVPLENFHTAAHVPPRPGDVWRVNFYRYNTVSTLPGDHLELYAWSPTLEKRFNLPHRFGFLEFA